MYIKTTILVIIFIIISNICFAEEEKEIQFKKAEPTFQYNKFGGTIGFNSLHNNYDTQSRGNGISVNLFLQNVDIFRNNENFNYDCFYYLNLGYIAVPIKKYTTLIPVNFLKFVGI
jgi:hypothetical protein